VRTTHQLHQVPLWVVDSYIIICLKICANQAFQQMQKKLQQGPLVKKEAMIESWQIQMNFPFPRQIMHCQDAFGILLWIVTLT
jgi:hypothetical protein